MIDLEVVHIEETDSTNRWMKENGSQKDMVVVAEYQTAGKGCGSNSWESERGKNLLCSVMIHPEEIQAKNQFIITQTVSVALCKALENYISEPVEIKWPNDIYVGDKKICGVLIENRLQGHMVKDTIIGVGLNVNQTEFKSDAPNPVSMKQLTGEDTDCEEVLKAFIDEMNECRRTRTFIADYKARLYRRKGKHKFMTQNTIFEASIVDVKDDGRLMLEDEKGVAHLFRFKEVTFII